MVDVKDLYCLELVGGGCKVVAESTTSIWLVYDVWVTRRMFMWDFFLCVDSKLS